MRRLLLLFCLAIFATTGRAQLHINEISQGTGNQEYVEFIVTGPRTCTDSTRDLRGIIFDDNPGWYTSQGFGAGCYRFAPVAAWSAVPIGSIILIYNIADPNPSITAADDPMDLNGDGVYVLPSDHASLQVAALPAATSTTFNYSTITAWSAPTAVSWDNIIAMGNNGDAFHVVNPAVSATVAIHSVGWNGATGGAQSPTIYFTGSASGIVYSNTAGQPSVQTSWASGAVPANETPAAGNTPANTGWISAMKISPTGAGRMYVDSSVAASGSGRSWASPKKTVAEALAVANSGSCVNQVWVKKGTYLPTTRIGAPTTSRDSSFRVLRNGIKIFGGFGGNDTTMATRNPTLYPTHLSGDIGTPNSNADNSYQVVRVQTGASAVADSVILDGFTVRNGNASITGMSGGGIFCDNNTGTFTLAVRNSVIRDNRAANVGGGLRVNATPQLLVSDCTFLRDTASTGGGALSIDNATAVAVLRNVFEGNITTANGGGAVKQVNGTVIMERNSFLSNRAGHGGAVRIELTTAGWSRVKDNVFSRNVSITGGGGGLSMYTPAGVASSTWDTVVNNVFVQNRDQSTGGGGGVNLCGGNHQIINNTFFADTSTSGAGGAIKFECSSNLATVFNNIFYKNSASSGADLNTTAVQALGNNSLNTTNPLFTDETDPDGADNIWATGDDGLRIQLTSPARNTGSNAALPPAVTTDLKGGPRVIGVAVDMGAYEAGALLRGPAGIDTGIVLWLDGSDVDNNGATINPANATALTTWKDVSGNTNDATMLAGQGTPVMNTAQVNGKDVVKFTRTSQTLGTVYNVPGVDIRSVSMPKTTIFTVYRQGTAIAGEQQGIWGDDDGAWDRFFMSRFGTNNGIVSVGPPANNVAIANAGVTGETKLLTAVYDSVVANGSTIYFNALPVQSVTDNTSPTAAQSTLRIGWDGDDNAYNGDIAEMVVYKRKLTDCEIKAVNRYFGYKYGVALSTATITPAPSTYFCGGSTTLTGASATPGASFTWLQNGSLVPGANGPTYNATAAGNYQVVASAGGCADTSAITVVQPLSPVLRVDGSVAVSGTGATWASPLKTVDEALDLANAFPCVAEIRVKGGTYYPMANPTTVATSPDSSFRILRNGIKVYGGFGGTDTTFATRNPVLYPTILSGDIGTPNDSTDNSYHVVTIVAAPGTTIDSSTKLDGFTVTRGRASGTGTAIVNGQNIARQDGGGVYISGSIAPTQCSPVLRSVIIQRNSAVFGGGLYTAAGLSGLSSPYFFNCSIANNRATNAGGGVFHNPNTGGSTPRYFNCTFTFNTALSAGAVSHTGSGLYDGCAFTGNSATSGAGGAVLRPTTGLVTFNNTVFTANTATTTGGAIHQTNGLPASFNLCTFTGNTAANGGAVYTLISLAADSCTFAANQATAAGGGLVVTNGATATLTFSTFTDCNAVSGGAIEAYDTSTTNLTNCTFSLDSASFTGGAMRINESSTVNATACRFLDNYSGLVGAVDNGIGFFNARHCIFSGNKGTLGGAINNYQGSTANVVTVTNSVFSGNQNYAATGDGGAIHAGPGTTTTVSNCTFSDNITASTANAGGNAIAADGGATVTVNNSIVWGGAAQQVSGTITFANSDVKGLTPTATNLNIDPRFVSPLDPDGPDNMWATLDDGLRLDTCSPAIGAGSNGLIPAGIITDLTGAARIQLTTVDMGAYEHGYDFTGYPEVTISATPQPACAGVSVVFTATPANGGGSAAAYQWFRNSTSQQTSASPTFTTSTLANNDTVWAVLTNTYCGYFDTSNRFVVTITGISSAPGAITGLDTVCAGTTQPYSVAAVPGALSYIWSLPGGWTGTSTTASIATVPSATSGPVSVKVVNSCGISDSSSRMVTVRTPLGQPSAITGPASPCAGTSQTYSIAAMPGATSGYTWTLPAGGGWAINGPAAGNAIAVTVGTTSGTVTITASNGCGPGVQQTLSVTPNDVPAQPAAIAGNATPCTGVSTTYSVPAVPNTTSYTWTTPTGWTSTPSANSLATVPAATAGTVTVTAANICGPGASQTLTVTPVGTPAQPGAIASPAAICAGISGTYSVAAVPGATSYTWSLPTGWSVTGPATGASINATAGASGTISVIASTVCGASAPRTATVAVQTTPAQPAAITGASPVCSGTQNVYIAAPVSGATSYTWTLPPGWTGGSASGAILATAGPAGSGQITVSAQNACGTSGAASIPVVVNAVTPTSLSISPSTPSNVVCPGVPVTFTANATGAGLTPTYTWTRNGTAQQGFNSPTFTIANLQNGEVIGLSMASGAVCPAPATLTAAPIAMTVLPAVVPGININTQYSTVPVICAATQLDFVANIVGGGTAPTYQWWRNGAVVSTGGPTYSASGWTSGEVVYAMLLSNAQCATPAQINSNAVTVTVTPTVAPVVQISASPGTTFSAGQAVTFSATVIQGGGAAPLFQWMRNSQAIIGAFGPVYTTANLTGGDTISVRLTSGDPCAAPAVAFSNKVVMTKSTTSVGAVGGGGMGVSLYPNPNEGRFTLAITAPRAGLRTGVEVLNALGQVVYFREVVTERAEWTAPIELSGVANGIYLLRLKSEDGSVATMRFEVRR